MIVGEDRERRLEIPRALAVALGIDQQAFDVAVAADLLDGDEEVLQTISGRRQSASRTSPWRQAVEGLGEERECARASDAAGEVRRNASAFVVVGGQLAELGQEQCGRRAGWPWLPRLHSL